MMIEQIVSAKDDAVAVILASPYRQWDTGTGSEIIQRISVP